MNILKKNQVTLGEYNNYVIGGNISNQFAIGEIGSSDDFYFIGAEPTEESPYPILSGNILDSNGDLLFRLVRNVIISNPKNCYKISGDFIGYEIVDSEGVLILKVETKFESIPSAGFECFVTTIKANFYNKNKELVFFANSGDEDESISSSSKLYIGNSGLISGYSPEELDFVRFSLKSNGKIYEALRGKHRKERIVLDGKCMIDADLKDCEIEISTGDFAAIGSLSITECNISFKGGAANIYNLVKSNDKK